MKTKLAIIVLGAAAGIALVGAIIFGVFQYRRYLALNERLPENAIPIHVNIVNPQDGAQSPAGTALPVSVTAVGASPLVALELWANGILVGVQVGPFQGVTPLNATFAWIPATGGDYTLIARAIDQKKQSAASLAVQVAINSVQKKGASDEPKIKRSDREKGIPIANGIDAPVQDGQTPATVPLPGLLELPGNDVPPAEPFQTGPGDFISQGFIDVPPAPPALAATDAECSVKLYIQDNSNNEEGFFIYRQAADMPAWQRIATLDGQSANKWISFTDSKVAGALSYYAAAFNAKGEAAGNFVSVHAKGSNCFLSKIPPLSFSLGKLGYTGPADRAYCYRSFDNQHWSRVPLAGFFPKVADGFDARGLGDEFLLKEQMNKKVSLSLDCWGWLGDSLISIGKLHRDEIDLQTAGDILEKSGGLSANLVFDPGAYKPMDGSSDTPIKKQVTDGRAPSVTLQIGYGIENCKKKLPSQGQDAVETFLFCLLYYPTYGAAEQPFLYWNVAESICDNDSDHNGGPPCRPLQWYKDRAAQYGGTAGFKVRYYDPAGAGSYIDVGLTPLKERTTSIPPLDVCSKMKNIAGKWVTYQVMVAYDAGPNDPDYANQVLVGKTTMGTANFEFRCLPPAPEEVTLTIEPTTLKLGNVDDNDGSDPQDVEVYGYLGAATFDFKAAFPSGRVLLAPETLPSNCADETIEWPGVLYTSGIADCRPFLQNGTYDLKGMKLCNTLLIKQTGNKISQSPSERDCYLEDFGSGQNHIRITVRDGDTLFLTSYIIDYDSASADDAVCVGVITLGPYWTTEWADKFKNGVDKVMSQADNGSASCKVTWKIKALTE